MAKKIRAGLGVPAALCCLLWLGYTAVVWCDKTPETETDRLIYPPEQTVLLSGNFDVIARTAAAELALDGRPLKSEPFQPPLRVAHVRLPPGVHELQMGERLVEFVVAMNEEEHDGPPDWPIQRHHPMEVESDRCADCHQTQSRDGRTLLGRVKSRRACFECHKSVDFDVTHSHPLEPLEDCQMCHTLHGSSGPSLLKAPAKRLCLKCHDADEFSDRL